MKNINAFRSLFLLSLSFFLYIGCSIGQTNKPLVFNRSIHPLKTQGRWIVNADNGQKRLLRGVNVSGMEYDSTGTKVNLAMLEDLTSNWPINIVRLPVNQDWWLRDIGGTYRKLIDERIQFLASKEIYTLLDLQWIDTKLKIDPLPNDLSIEFWRQIAKKYKNKAYLLYDIYNEPRNCQHKDWAEKAIGIIKAIRLIDSKALVFVNGIDWGYDIGGFIDKPLKFKNIVYGTHIYPQKPGSGYKNKAEYEKYWLGILSKNLPLFAGEFGTEELESANMDQIDNYLKPLLVQFTKSEIGYTAWSWTNKPFITSNGSGDSKKLTPFGSAVYEHLTNTKK